MQPSTFKLSPSTVADALNLFQPWKMQLRSRLGPKETFKKGHGNTRRHQSWISTAMALKKCHVAETFWYFETQILSRCFVSFPPMVPGPTPAASGRGLRQRPRTRHSPAPHWRRDRGGQKCQQRRKRQLYPLSLFQLLQRELPGAQALQNPFQGENNRNSFGVIRLTSGGFLGQLLQVSYQSSESFQGKVKVSLQVETKAQAVLW